jgi:hypothetical protein
MGQESLALVNPVGTAPDAHPQGQRRPPARGRRDEPRRRRLRRHSPCRVRTVARGVVCRATGGSFHHMGRVDNDTERCRLQKAKSSQLAPRPRTLQPDTSSNLVTGGTLNLTTLHSAVTPCPQAVPNSPPSSAPHSPTLTGRWVRCPLHRTLTLGPRHAQPESVFHPGFQKLFATLARNSVFLGF